LTQQEVYLPVAYDVSKLTPPRHGGSVRTPWYDHISDHPSNGLTPQKLRSLLRRAEDGDLTAQAELYEDIADKDPTLVAVFDTRKLAVLSKPWEVIPVEGSGRKGEKQAEARTKMLENMSLGHMAALPGLSGEYMDFEGLMFYLMDSIARGFSAAIPVWDPKTWEIVAVKQHAQKHFILGDIRKLGKAEYNPYELRKRTIDDQAFGEEILPYEFIIHWYRGKSGLPSRMGLLRTLTWWYLFKNYAMRSWVKAAERFGMPLVWGQYDPNMGDSDREVVEEAVKNLGLDGGAVTTIGTELKIIEAKGGNITGDIWKSLMHQCDMEFSKAVLGHSSTTESTPGKLGAEDQSLQVQAYRTESDAKALERTVNNQIIQPCNIHIEGKDLCYFKIRYEADEDLNSKADRYVKLITAGARIGEKHFHETFDLPIPEEGERLIAPASTDPLAAALGGALGGQMQNKRVIANSAMFANVAGRSMSQRIARKQTALSETDALESEYLNKLQRAYETLVEGLPVSDDAVDMIKTDDFIEAFGKVSEEMIESAIMISGREMMDRNLLTGVAANKVNPFEIRSMSALDWLRYQSFTLTQIEGEVITLSLAKRIKDELINFADTGMTPKQFYARVLDAEGIGKIGKGHLQTVLRTNIATARSAGVELAVQKNADAFPAWQYIAVNDSRTRDSHSALDGKIFAWTDKKYWPPLGYNCRCEASPIHESEMTEQAHAVAQSTQEETEVPRGFGSDARVNYSRWVDKLSRENENIRTRLATLNS
jgi:SPP1 gp7 family putative phage head morphogenesis protein